MKAITTKDIMKLEPCYSPSKYISEEWKGTVEAEARNTYTYI